MPDPKFGVIYSRLHPVVPIPEFAHTIEDAGYDSLWVTEGLVNEMPALDIMLALGAFVQHTKRLTVGTCVVLVPLRNPAILAKETATLDFLSEGRVVLGVGVGGSSNSRMDAFTVCGVDPRERGARADETLEIMTKLWSGKPVSHSGRFYSFEGIEMGPVPVQKPHPPLWAGGEAEGVLRRAARWCQGFVPSNPGVQEYVRLWDRIEGYADKYGTDTSKITKAVHLYFAMGESRESALDTVRATLAKRYGFEPHLPDLRAILVGTPDDCVQTIEDHMKVGVTHFVLNAARPLTEVKADYEKFAETVLPRFR